MGEVFGKAFRILDERKSHWVQNFHGNFQVNVSWFLAFFVVLLDWVTLILVFLKKISSACIRYMTKLFLLLKLMMSQAVEGM